MSREPRAEEPEEPAPPVSSIVVTPWPTMGLLVLIGAALSWVVVRLIERVTQSSPVLPWTLALLLWLMAGGVGVLAWTTYQRVHRERRWIAASRGIRLLAMGKSASIVGSLGVGFLCCFALLFIDKVLIPVSLQRVVIAGIGAVGSLALALAGRWLQKSCHLPTE